MSTLEQTVNMQPLPGDAWRFASRLNSFKNGMPTQSTEAAIRRLAKVDGISAVELNYPQHFSNPADGQPISLAARLGLSVTALNLRFDPPRFVLGSFAHPEATVRAAAIEIAAQAMRLAQSHGIGHVILWLGPDGFDYPFQVDYAALWGWLIEGVNEVARIAPDVRLSIEYKPSEPRSFALVRGMSDALLLARDAGESNVGVTLDFCHALMCGESPAMSAALALREGKLFGVHLNDGYGQADDGAMVASIHPTQTLELLRVLRLADWSGTIYFDTFPNRVDPELECAINIATVRKLNAALDRMNDDQISNVTFRQDGAAAVALVRDLLHP